MRGKRLPGYFRSKGRDCERKMYGNLWEGKRRVKKKQFGKRMNQDVRENRKLL